MHQVKQSSATSARFLGVHVRCAPEGDKEGPRSRRRVCMGDCQLSERTHAHTATVQWQADVKTLRACEPNVCVMSGSAGNMEWGPRHTPGRNS
eukprot:scaffold105511_cov93-Phaeocystis_antarctica.AAC.1